MEASVETKKEDDETIRQKEEENLLKVGLVKYPPVVYVSQLWEEKQQREKQGQQQQQQQLLLMNNVEDVENDNLKAHRSKATEIFHVKHDEDKEADDTDDDRPNWAFVHVINILLKAATKLRENRELITSMQTKVMETNQWYDDLRTKYQNLVKQLDLHQRERSRVEGELIDKMKLARFNLRKAQLYRSKVRITRLMNHVSPTGHTVISWAAALGFYEAVDEMLSRGAPVGYTAPYQHMAATFLQLSYQIYRLGSSSRLPKAKPATPENGDPIAQQDDASITSDVLVDPNLAAEKSATNLILEKMFELKDRRTKILKMMVFLRSRHRFPIPEAVYAGKWEIVKRIHERRLFHYHCSSSWVFPSPPPPLLPKVHHHHRHRRITLLELITHGMNDYAAGAYIDGSGWVPPNDPQEPYGEMQTELSELWAKIEEIREAFISNRRRIRILVQEKRRQEAGKNQISDAIRTRDFRKCILLAQQGASIDFENEDGYTALLAASEENTAMVNHVFMINDDGRACLEVEFLLDRTQFRPGIDVEVRSGFNPLIRACALNRYHVVEALLDRGADIDHVNRFKRTALHYAAEVGSIECTRILIERGANLHLVDQDGKTAYNLADDMGFLHIIKMISQYSTGYFGPLRVTRGRVQDTISCPLGCAKAMYRFEVAEHILECPLRDVECPLGCGQPRLLARELEEHSRDFCPRRLVYCKDCYADVPLCDLEQPHHTDECTHRLVDCSLGCGQRIKWVDLERHTRLCTWRMTTCPLFCGESMTFAESYVHVKKTCINRRISCPLKCAALVVAKQLAQHIADVCPCKELSCQYCNKAFMRKELAFHEKTCGIRLEPCRNKCGQRICILDMDKHMEEECTHRFVDCRLKCGLKLRMVDLDSHEQNLCAERLVPCPNHCLESNLVHPSQHVVCKFPQRLMDMHCRFECPKRQMSCSMCGLHMDAGDMPWHQQALCLFRVVNCTHHGCLKTLPYSQREDHERHQCRFRYITCAQGCGEQVLFLHAGKHMMNACSMRYVECALLCGEKMRHRDLQAHMEQACVRRFGAQDENMSAKIAVESFLSQRLSSRMSQRASSAASSSGSSLPSTPKSNSRKHATDSPTMEISRSTSELPMSRGSTRSREKG